MAYTANRMRAASERKMLDFDPDSASESIVDLLPGATGKLLPLSDGYEKVLAGLFRSVGTGAASTFRIFVADDADGATNATNVVSHALGSAPDAVGDTVWLEATGEQLRAASATAAYVGVKITLVTSTDECVVFFERAGAAFKGDNLTADFVS